MPQSSDSRAIGVFDSGIGGLTTVRELFSRLPRESVVYFGDTARLPYGNKSGETVTRFSLEIASFLVRQHVKCIVVACNTASSHALEALRERFGDKLFRTVIRQSIAYAESAERAVPILEYRPDRGSDYLSLASEILRRLGKQDLLEPLDELSAEVVPAGAYTRA